MYQGFPLDERLYIILIKCCCKTMVNPSKSLLLILPAVFILPYVSYLEGR